MTQPVRFAHVRNPKERLNYSIAYTFTNNNGSIIVNYGVSQCRKGDTFSRKDGRERAQARLVKGVVNGNNSLRYGTFTVNDAEGLSVGREVSKFFEAKRKAHLAERNDPQGPAIKSYR